ncbi:alpha/beta hydrolase [Vibrio chagasii]|nr:alpha/beta hydrolase [Vibrio chagasii]
MRQFTIFLLHADKLKQMRKMHLDVLASRLGKVLLISIVSLVS